MVFEWGPKHYSVDAGVVARIVIKLEKKYGICPPDALVQAGSRENSPIHRLFTWEDEIAAQKWRRQEARMIIDSIRIVQEETGEQVQAFYNVKVTQGEEVHQGYVSMSVVAEDPELQEQAIEDALRYLKAFQRRYRHLKALSGVFEAIDQLTL